MPGSGDSVRCALMQPEQNATDTALRRAIGSASRHPILASVIASVISAVVIGGGAALFRVFEDDEPSAEAQGDGGITAAERVQACVETHGLQGARTVTDDTATDTTRILRCAWPPATGSDPDGYLEISYHTVEGPGDSEASGAVWATRISAPCDPVWLSYSTASMGAQGRLEPFAASADTLVTPYGELWDGMRSELSFYPDRDEVVVIHNSKVILDDVDCSRP